METLYKEFVLFLENKGTKNIQTSIDKKFSGNSEYINIIVCMKWDMELRFIIERNRNRTPQFFLEMTAKIWDKNGYMYMNRNHLKWKSTEVWKHYEKIEEIFERWIHKQKDIRLQYIMNPEFLVEEDVILKYMKECKKDLV